MSVPPVICWLRRDLRLHDNRALHAAIETNQPVIVVFVLGETFVESERMGTPRWKFMLSALRSLDEELWDRGSALLVRRGDALPVLRDIIRETGADRLFFNKDYTPYAKQRDTTVIEGLDIAVESFHDRLLVAPESIETNSGKPYTVYTPFKRKWRETPKELEEPLIYQLRADYLHNLDGIRNDGVPTLHDLGMSDTINVPVASYDAALDRLRRFTDSKIYDYDDTRNTLANPFGDSRNGTSAMSPYIRFGLVSPRQIRDSAADAYRATTSKAKRDSVTAWMDEIIWHEFYTHVLWHYPHAAERNYNDKYDAVEWEWSADAFQKWADGQTGYPVIDAAMRQLQGTGWMHNRARMIVASFLTKDLLIDWREGEKHFMRWLLDGDIAANNGGWQWAAGTGTDAQPYFRIFNPISQSKKFDPDGTFIRQWVPELANVPDKFIHDPWTMDSPPKNYPPPIVDHKAARERTLKAFEVVKQQK